MLDPTMGQPAWPGMLASAVPLVAEMCPSPCVVYCVYQTGGCMEKPNCPALLTSPEMSGKPLIALQSCSGI